MLKFSDLSNSQKRFIVALIEFDEKFKTEGIITRQESITIAERLNALHSCDSFTRPRWLRANKTERGAYALPLPTDSEFSDMKTGIAPAVVAKEVVTEVTDNDDDEAVEDSRLFKVIEDSEVYDEDVEEFNQILRDFGIEV